MVGQDGIDEKIFKKVKKNNSYVICKSIQSIIKSLNIETSTLKIHN